jgi:hypothetical protein
LKGLLFGIGKRKNLNKANLFWSSFGKGKNQ